MDAKRTTFAQLRPGSQFRPVMEENGKEQMGPLCRKVNQTSCVVIAPPKESRTMTGQELCVADR
jgi:hypothetical protein